MAEQLSLIIRAKDLTKRGFASVGRGLRKLGSGIGRLTGRIAKGVAASVAALVGVGALMVREFTKTEDAIAKLNAVLKATEGAAGLSAEELHEHAKALEDVTKYSFDVVTNTQAILATFKNIKGDAFRQATEAILDMSAVIGQDAKQGAIQLGKALNDPIRGVTALTEVGVSFTDEQRKMIKSMADAGDIAGAQTIIFKELRSEFGGMAVAAGDTMSGAMERAKNSFFNIIKATGRAITKIMDLKSVFLDAKKRMDEFAASGKIEGWAAKIKPKVEEIKQLISDLFSDDEETQKKAVQKAKNIGQSIMDVLMEKAAAFGRVIGAAAREGWKMGATKFRESALTTGEQTLKEYGFGSGPQSLAAPTAKELAEHRAQIEQSPEYQQRRSEQLSELLAEIRDEIKVTNQSLIGDKN